jgi:hypothetical protein
MHWPRGGSHLTLAQLSELIGSGVKIKKVVTPVRRDDSGVAIEECGEGKLFNGGRLQGIFCDREAPNDNPKNYFPSP